MSHTSSMRALVRFLVCLWVIGLFGIAGPSFAADPAAQEFIQKAQDYRDQGKLKHAVIELKNALQENPENAEARLLLGQTYLDLTKGPAAEKEARRSSEP